MARYALIVVCTKAPTTGVKSIAEKIAQDLSKRWQSALSELDENSFSWPGSKKPRVLIDPTRGGFTDVLDEAEFEEGDELLFYYFGHSYPVGASKIAPAFKSSSIDSLKNNDFSWILEQIFDTPISVIYSILDTCHSGILVPELGKFENKIYCMVAAENGYTKGAFSEHLLRGLTTGDDDIRTMLYDNKAGGLTFESLFEYALDRMESDLDYSLPKAVGSLGATVLRKEEKGVPRALREHAFERTIYKRAYYLLNMISSGATDLKSLMFEVRRHECFYIKQNEEGKNVYISSGAIIDYIHFLSAIGLLTSHKAPFTLTDEGRTCSSKYEYNHILVTSILDKLFPQEVDVEKLKQIVWGLLKEGTPPDVLNVGRYMRNSGYSRVADPKSFKIAFKVLPYTGVFRRSHDALFPI